tara:strand:+ start:371 stop:1180 length:810 start_codon:yes stop_codon:yes gene_type:complete
MESLYLPQHDAFVRWHRVGNGGPVVVWLPGIGFPAVGNFLATATQNVLPQIQSILIDPLGAGSSDASKMQGLGISDQADVIAAVLDHLCHKSCFVLGYSMGGAIAAELTQRRPDLVSRLILAEGNLLTGGGAGTRSMVAVAAEEFRRESLPNMLAGLRTGALNGDKVDDFILSSWGHMDPDVLYEMAAALVALRPELEQEILNLTLPRWYIFGETNLTDPDTRNASNLPDPERLRAAGFAIRVLKGVGHDLMLSDPQGFAALIAPVLTP